MTRIIHSIWIALLFSFLKFPGSVAAPTEFSTGIVPELSFSTAENTSGSMTVFYPTNSPSLSFRMGPFVFEAAPNAPLIKNIRGLIVISHGLGGSSLGHRDIAVALSKKGFIVAAVLHSQDNYQYEADLNSPENWRSRSLEISAAISAIQTHAKFSEKLNGKPVGAFGFSRGGYTLLAVLGAAPTFQRMRKHCSTNIQDPTCKRATTSDPDGVKYIKKIPVEPRICAAVLADPFAAIFDDDALNQIRDIPIQVYLPENENELLAKFHGGRLGHLASQDRKHSVETIIFPNAQHFSFLSPFPNEIELPDEIRKEYEGFDRDQFHQAFHTQLIKFFEKKMVNCNDES